MKLLKKIAVILLIAQSSFGAFGVESGGGGDPQAVDFLLRVRVIAAWVKAGGGSLNEEKRQDVASIEQKLSEMMDHSSQTPIVMVDRNLVDTSGASKVALYSLETFKIEITRSKWQNLSEDEKYVTAGLELLGMAQVKERYKVAGLIQNEMPRILQINSTMGTPNSFQSCKTADGSFAIMIYQSSPTKILILDRSVSVTPLSFLCEKQTLINNGDSLTGYGCIGGGMGEERKVAVYMNESIQVANYQDLDNEDNDRSNLSCETTRY